MLLVYRRDAEDAEERREDSPLRENTDYPGVLDFADAFHGR